MIKTSEPALVSNYTLLQLRTIPAAGSIPIVPPETLWALDDASFAQLYHLVLLNVTRHHDQLTPALLTRLKRLAIQPDNASYYEQLQFLQALAYHALEQEQTARQLLAPLAVGTEATAGYYQQLLGLWQLQQGQYATAADQLALAATHHANMVSEARVYALALSGRVDSAQAIAARLIASADVVERQQGRQAQQLLAAGRVVPSQSSPQRVGDNWMVQARQQSKPEEAAKSYQRIVREAPFNEPAIIAAGAFYGGRRDYPAAYAALRAGLDENPHSLPLLRAYTLAAADAGLTEYAADALSQLRQQLPPSAYATLAAEYVARQAARAAASASFSSAPSSSPLQ